MNDSLGTDEYIQGVLEKYSDKLIKLAFTYVKNISDAEDIVQEVYIRLLRKATAFETDEHEKAWLLRVTINQCKNHLKSGWIRFKTPLQEDLSYLPSEDSSLLQAVFSLPEKYRSVVHLYYYESYSIDEIAALLHKKPATVGTWLSRGRNLLKARLTGGFENEP